MTPAASCRLRMLAHRGPGSNLRPPALFGQYLEQGPGLRKARSKAPGENSTHDHVGAFLGRKPLIELMARRRDGRSRFQAFGSPRIRPNQLGLADLVLLGSPPEVSNLHVGGERLHVQRGEPETIMVSSVPFRRGGGPLFRPARILVVPAPTFPFFAPHAPGELVAARQ